MKDSADTGQICMATTRVYVAAAISETFKEKYAAAVSQYQQGPP